MTLEIIERMILESITNKRHYWIIGWIKRIHVEYFSEWIKTNDHFHKSILKLHIFFANIGAKNKSMYKDFYEF